MQDLSEILGGAPAPEPSTVEAEPTPAPEQVAAPEPAPTTTVEQQERARNERGQFVKAEPVTPPVEERSHTVPVAAMLEERRKRQELEARLAALQPKAPEVKDEDFWQAPAQATRQLVDYQAQQVQSEILNLKYELAEDLTRSLHPDYDAVREEFVAKVTSGDPWAVAIAQQMGAKPNPAKFVYDQSKKLAALSEFEQAGSLDALRARIEAEVRAKILTEQSRPAPPPAVPQSLNSVPSAPTSVTPADFQPTPMENLFERPF